LIIHTYDLSSVYYIFFSTFWCLMWDQQHLRDQWWSRCENCYEITRKQACWWKIIHSVIHSFIHSLWSYDESRKKISIKALTKMMKKFWSLKFYYSVKKKTKLTLNLYQIICWITHWIFAVIKRSDCCFFCFSYFFLLFLKSTSRSFTLRFYVEILLILILVCMSVSMINSSQNSH